MASDFENAGSGVSILAAFVGVFTLFSLKVPEGVSRPVLFSLATVGTLAIVYGQTTCTITVVVLVNLPADYLCSSDGLNCALPCLAGQFVHDKTCVPCLAGQYSLPGGDPTGEDTSCTGVVAVPSNLPCCDKIHPWVSL